MKLDQPKSMRVQRGSWNLYTPRKYWKPAVLVGSKLSATLRLFVYSILYRAHSLSAYGFLANGVELPQALSSELNKRQHESTLEEQGTQYLRATDTRYQ